MGLLGIFLGLGLLVWFAFRGWSVLLLAPAAAIVAAAFAGEPLLAHWTQTFMGSATRFLAQFFPIFLLGALFGKLMEDSGSVSAISAFMTERLGQSRAMLAVVLAGAWIANVKLIEEKTAGCSSCGRIIDPQPQPGATSDSPSIYLLFVTYPDVYVPNVS